MLIAHSALYLVAKIVPGLLGMATTALLTRLLSPEQYGLYGLALVVMIFGATMVFDWLGLVFLRVYQPGRADPRVIGTFVHLFIGLVGVTAVLALLALACGLFHGREAAAYGSGLVLMWAYAWFELVSRFEIANFRPVRYLWMNLARAAFILVGAAGGALATGDPLWAAAGTAAGTFAGAGLGGFRGWGLGRRHFDGALAKRVLLFGLPLAASLALSAATTSGTRALVQWLGSLEALGLYTAAFMLVQNTLAVAASGIASASYSLAVRAVETGDPAVARCQLLANGGLMLAVLSPAALGMALTAHGIAVTLVGPSYVDAVARLTPWMAAGGYFASIRSHYLDHAFQLGKRPALQVWVTAVAAIVAVGLSLWLIPLLGPLGAAIAVTVGMAGSCVHAAIAGRHAYALPMPAEAARGVAGACAFMAICVLLVPGDDTRAFLARAMVGAASYAAAAIALDVLGSRAVAVRLLAQAARRPRIALQKGAGKP